MWPRAISMSLAVFAFASGCATRPADQAGNVSSASAINAAPVRAPVVGADEAKADLDELLAVVSDLHPRPFWSTSSERVRAEIETIIAEARASNGLSPQDWYRAVSRVVVSLDDPHMWVFVPGWTTYVQNGGTFLPVAVRVRGQRVTISEGPDDLLGAELVSINGVPLSQLLREYRDIAGQPDDPYAQEWLALYMPRYLWFFRGWSGPFVLGVRDNAGERRVQLDGVTLDAANAWNADAGPPLEYRDLGDNVGLLTFRACVAGEQIQTLATPIFRSIKAGGIDRLIVDARDNAGGGDDAWIALLDYLTDRPYSGYRGSRFRVSQRLKDMLGESGVRAKFGDDAWLAEDGREFSFTLQAEDLRVPQNPPEKFTGRWCVLAGPGTFSSGMSFVCAVKAYGLAPVIGEETGGRVRGFGQWERVTLPRTGLQVAISTKEFIGAVDVPYRRGVPPDVFVREDRTSDTSNDPTVQAALAELRKTP